MHAGERRVLRHVPGRGHQCNARRVGLCVPHRRHTAMGRELRRAGPHLQLNRARARSAAEPKDTVCGEQHHWLPSAGSSSHGCREPAPPRRAPPFAEPLPAPSASFAERLPSPSASLRRPTWPRLSRCRGLPRAPRKAASARRDTRTHSSATRSATSVDRCFDRHVDGRAACVGGCHASRRRRVAHGPATSIRARLAGPRFDDAASAFLDKPGFPAAKATRRAGGLFMFVSDFP